MRIANALRLVVLVALGALWALPHARADCPKWLPGDGFGGINGSVNAMTVWDPDGEGPELALLVVGGEFNFAGDVAVNNIAAWDGQSWRALGAGITRRVALTFLLPNSKLPRASCH